MRRSGNLKHESGFTLIELIIVICVIGIVAGASTFGFNQMMEKSRVQAQVRQMVTDISELRVRSITLKRRHSVTFNASSYVFRTYSSDDENLNSGGTILPYGTKNVKYKLKDLSLTDYDGSVRYEIDARGMLTSSAPASVFLDYNGSSGIDCLTIHVLRINAGKKSNGAPYDCKAN